MTGTCEPLTEQLCGCCAGQTQETPEVITNRPALSSIAYRAGRHATFNASMLAALSDPAYPALAGLRTRETTDFSIALLDAWAVTLDILTFYQERCANEAYLRTAVDQRSVIELATLVGYRPSPGVAASTVLAFTLSSAPGSPDDVPIPAGTRVQSVPGPGQTAQVFETSADLTAVIGWNALPARTTIPWRLAAADTGTWIAGTATHISPGDALLFVSAHNGQPLATGPSDFHYVTEVFTDTTVGSPTAGCTRISWEGPLSPNLFPSGSAATADVCLYIFRRKAALYGVQAPNPQMLAGPNISSVPGWPAKDANDKDTPRGHRWDYLYVAGSAQINLDASYQGLQRPANASSGPPQWVVLTGPLSSVGQMYTGVFQITATADTNPGYYTLTSKTTQVTLADPQILAGDPTLGLDALLQRFVVDTPDVTAYVQSAPLTPAELPITTWALQSQYPLQPGMLAPVTGTSIAVSGGQQIAPNQPVGISGRALRLWVSAGTFTPNGSSGGVQAAAGQQFRIDEFPPVDDPDAAGFLLWTVTSVSGIAGTLSVTADATELTPSASSDPVVGEAVTVQSVAVDGDVSTLILARPMSRIYDAATVTVNANAVQATNGQTVHEILGSGDGTSGALQFTLKQARLTYLSTPAGNGSQSTLQVWVNNLQWHETANLLTSGPADRVFVISTNSAGNTAVQFGNGVEGARTPTGTSNIRATYRVGVGSAGMVSAGQLTQPLDRPQGLSTVTNPSAATGAADPATPDQIRARAPLPTLTLGRVVSLEDYQNYALAFAGIAKALATWTWFGNIRGVFLTVAGENGATLRGDDPVVTSLIGAIRLCGDPHVPLRVVSFEPLRFTFTAGVSVDQVTYDPDQVLAQVWQNVCGAYAFEPRQLAQRVAASDIVEVMQQTPGVVAVQLQALGLSGETAAGPVPPLLCASGPVPPQGAQMLLLDPATQGSIGLWS